MTFSVATPQRSSNVNAPRCPRLIRLPRTDIAAAFTNQADRFDHDGFLAPIKHRATAHDGMPHIAQIDAALFRIENLTPVNGDLIRIDDLDRAPLFGCAGL